MRIKIFREIKINLDFHDLNYLTKKRFSIFKHLLRLLHSKCSEVRFHFGRMLRRPLPSQEELDNSISYFDVFPSSLLLLVSRKFILYI